MADRRLVWNQVAAPDLSGASAALARANQSFTSGLDSAQGILAKYGEGQVEKADNELLGELAALGGEEEFDSFVDGGGLSGRNISQGLRDHVLSMRTGFVADEGVRARTGLTGAQTESTRANTGIRLAQEGRVAGDHAYGLRQRDELAGLSGALVGARGEARQHGNQGVPQGAVQSQVYQGLLDRGFPEHVAQGFMMNFQDESGFDIDITEAEPNVHGTRGRGLYQLTGSRRDAFEAKYGNDYSIDNQLDFLVEELGGSESRARDLIFNSQNAGEAGANIVNNFLRPASEHARERTARYVGQGGFTPSGPQTYATPQRDAFTAALANSETLTPAQINALLGQVNGAQAAGQSLQDDAAARATAEGQQLVDEIGASVINAALSDPNVQTQEQLIAAVRQDERLQNLTESEILNLTNRAAAAGGDEAFGSVLAPSVQTNPVVQSTQQLLEGDLAAAASATPQARMVGSLADYQANPTESLISELGIGADGENPGGLGGLVGFEAGFDSNDLTNTINDYARKFGVTPEVAAVAMREAFDRDPTGRNTIARRFPEEDVRSIIESSLSQDSIRDYREQAQVREQTNQRANAIVNQITQLQRAAAKGGDTGQIQQQIADLYIELSTLRQNNPVTAPNN